MNAAVLSIALGSRLGPSDQQALELGTGALLADVGMLNVPDEVRFARRRLTPAERHEIERHPCHTYDCLQPMTGLDESTLLVGYQVHERLDRSGYPRARPGYAIHPYARIAAVADTYAALSKPRPHRPAHSPHAAAACILNECGQGRLDQDVVRVFLDVIGLYPVRSYVELNNGTEAIVLRTTPTSPRGP